MTLNMRDRFSGSNGDSFCGKYVKIYNLVRGKKHICKYVVKQCVKIKKIKEKKKIPLNS